MENRLTTISTIYNAAPNRPVKFNQLAVQSNLIRNINNCYNKVRIQLGSNIEHPNLELLDFDIRSILFKYNLGLVPLSEQISSIDFENKLKIIIEEFKPYITNREPLDLFVANLKILYAQPTHIYIEPLNSIIKYGTQNYSIISKYKLSSAEKFLISNYFKNFNLEFITFNEFNKNIKLHDVVILVGSPNIFHPFLFDHINANSFSFIYFDIYHHSLKYIALLDHSKLVTSSVRPIFSEHKFIIDNEVIVQMIPEENEITDTVILEEPSLPSTFLNHYIQTSDFPNDKTIECRLIELENGQYIFEEIGQKAKCDIINFNNEYVRKHIDSIEIDDYLVIIQFNSWDARKNFADHYFKEEDILKDRNNLNKIKSHISKQIEKYGLERYTDHLNKKLNLSLKYYQINGLTKVESFYLRNKKDFYKLLLHFTKNDNYAQKLFNSCFKLANLHQKIGHIARKELREFLKGNSKDFNGLQDNNTLYIPNMDYLKIDLFKINNISSQIYEVPSSKVGTIIKLNYEEVYT